MKSSAFACEAARSISAMVTRDGSAAP